MTNNEIEELALKFQNTGDDSLYAKFYEELYSRFRFHLYRYYKNLHGDNIDLVCSDALYKIWHNISLFDINKGKFSTWCYAILRFTALKAIQDQAKMTEYIEYKIDIIEDDTDDREIYDFRLKIVKDALEELTYPLREFIDDKYVLGLTNKEIAIKYNIPMYTVKNRIFKGLRLMRETIAKHKKEAMSKRIKQIK